MDTAHFQIAATPVGGRVHINGRDVTDEIIAADIRIGSAEPTIVSLHLKAGGDPSVIEGRGVVQVVAGIDTPQTVVEFLSQVDPGQLEQAALFLDGAGTLTQKMLAVLIDQAEATG